ncbi:unnamed protein product, partial [Closterium sp. NIES-53]
MQHKLCTNNSHHCWWQLPLPPSPPPSLYPLPVLLAPPLGMFPTRDMGGHAALCGMAWVDGMGHGWCRGWMAVEALASLAYEWNDRSGVWRHATNVQGVSTWMRGEDCNSMEAVRCDGDGHVIALTITDRELDHCNQLPRSLPDTLGRLTSPMGHSTASHGNLKASVLQELGNLQQLTRLSLSRNHLLESLPEQLSQLQKLQSLHVSNHDFSGELPAWIFSLTDLTSLIIQDNNYSGSIPEAISSLKQLRELALKESDLTGSIPKSIGALTNLENLWLHCYSMSGTIPAFIAHLTALTTLVLYQSGLSGSIPEAISSLKLLQRLDLSKNSLSGSIPEAMSSLKQLGD